MPRQEASRRLDIRKTYKNLQKPPVFQWFLASPKGQHEASCGGVGSSWGLLAALGALLGALGASWGRLGRVLGPLEKAYEKDVENIFKKEPKEKPVLAWEREAR